MRLEIKIVLIWFGAMLIAAASCQKKNPPIDPPTTTTTTLEQATPCPDQNINPWPHYGQLNGKCLKSCGASKGTVKASCDGIFKVEAYDAKTCCVAKFNDGPFYPCADSTKPFPHYALKDGACTPSCGTIKGTTMASCDGLKTGDSYDVPFCCLPNDPVYTARKGAVSLSNKALKDGDGEFVALGATTMWLLHAYQNDKAKLDRNLKFLKENGFDYVRALGALSRQPLPADNFWANHQMYSEHPTHAIDIAGLTDYAYDKFGLRIEWTLFGGAFDFDYAQKQSLVDRFLAMSKGREHKIIHFEIANEYWQNGFTAQEVNQLTKYMNDRTNILVAASAPFGIEDVPTLYGGNVADIGTWHFDRDTSKADGYWRPVRQPWEYQFTDGMPKAGSNNEPIGCGSSVVSDCDPMRMVMGALNTYVSGLPLHVYHSSMGVRGIEDFTQINQSATTAFKNIRKYLPDNLTNWSLQNAHWVDYPFIGDNIGEMSTTSSGAVRAYGALAGESFIIFPIGIMNYLDIKPKKAMHVDIYHPISGALIQSKELAANENLRLQGLTAYVVKGYFK